MQMYPEELTAALELGHSYLERSKLEPAQKIFSGVTAIAPQNAYAWFGLGLIAQAQGDLERAHQLVSHSVQLDPRAPGARVALAEIQARRGEPAAALAALEPILASLPSIDSTSARRARALALSLGATLPK